MISNNRHGFVPVIFCKKRVESFFVQIVKESGFLVSFFIGINIDIGGEKVYTLIRIDRWRSLTF